MLACERVLDVAERRRRGGVRQHAFEPRARGRVVRAKRVMPVFRFFLETVEAAAG
jgi:hypothetical protein